MKNQIQNYLPGDHPWQNQIYWYDSIDSTNTQAKKLVLEGAVHGTVLIADHQTGGRGRMGRSFHSPEGTGLYMSVILRYDCTPDALMHLTCATAVAACNALEKACGFRPGIKWTNDLVYGDRKLAGILTELVLLPNQTAAVIGIGINCLQNAEDFPEDIRGFAGSLAMISGKPIDRAKVAAALLEALQEMDAALLTDQDAVMEVYRQDCVTVGKDISLLRGNDIRHGHAVGIDDSGALLVRFADGHTETVNSGEVSIRGMYGYI